MSIATRYFELKDENKLPISGRFIDPYDNTIFRIQQQDKLGDIVTRVIENRRKNDYPEIDESTLKSLIVMTLVETCSDSDLRKYFVAKATIPQVSQVISFTKALAYETVHSNNVSIKDKQSRAQKCLGCPFHKSRGVAPTIINNIPLNILKDSLTYPEESALGICGLCGCGLNTKIRFQVTGILAGITPEQLDHALRVMGVAFFDKCWIPSEALQVATTKKLLQAKLGNGNMSGDKILDVYISSKVKSVKNGK